MGAGPAPPPVAPLMEEDEDEDTEAGGAKAGLEGVGFAAGIAPEGEGCKLLVLLPLSMVGANVSLRVGVSEGEGARGMSEEVDDKYHAKLYGVCAFSKQHQDRNVPVDSS